MGQKVEFKCKCWSELLIASRPAEEASLALKAPVLIVNINKYLVFLELVDHIDLVFLKVL